MKSEHSTKVYAQKDKKRHKDDEHGTGASTGHDARVLLHHLRHR